MSMNLTGKKWRFKILSKNKKLCDRTKVQTIIANSRFQQSVNSERSGEKCHYLTFLCFGTHSTPWEFHTQRYFTMMSTSLL